MAADSKRYWPLGYWPLGYWPPGYWPPGPPAAAAALTGFAAISSSLCGTIAAAMGTALTHTTIAGAETAIAAATFSEDPPEMDEVVDGRATIRRARCTIDSADVAAPARGETITRGSVLWTIENKPMPVGGDYWQIDLKRITAHEKTRRGHRLAR